MRAKANEFIDFWTRISVHSAEQYEVPNGEQGVTELARRCIAMAETVGLSKERNVLWIYEGKFLLKVPEECFISPFAVPKDDAHFGCPTRCVMSDSEFFVP